MCITVCTMRYLIKTRLFAVVQYSVQGQKHNNFTQCKETSIYLESKGSWEYKMFFTVQTQTER